MQPRNRDVRMVYGNRLTIVQSSGYVTAKSQARLTGHKIKWISLPARVVTVRPLIFLTGSCLLWNIEGTEGRISALLAVPNTPADERKNVLDDVAVERWSEVRDSWVFPSPTVAWVDVWTQSCPVSMYDDLFAGGRKAAAPKVVGS